MKIGQLVANRYEIEGVLGMGGMSTVFRARDNVLGRRVALKVLHEQHSHDAEYVERFRREARAIARLSHPNIVTVIDRGEFDGSQYIVFEYVSGANLKELLEREGPLPVELALALAHQAARGLAFAHQHGVVHRDVKPQNVLVDENGTAKVTDFGIARSAGPDEALTLTGTVMGTSDYISPEQASGVRVDERSDQYALGGLLYELLTGEVPYPSENAVTAAMRHLQEPPPSVRSKRPEVSPRVDELVRRAMAKRPHDRFPALDAMVAALEACLAEEAGADATDDGATQILTPLVPPRRREPERHGRGPEPARRPTPRRRPPWAPLLAALGVVLLGAGLLAYFVSREGGTAGGGGAPVRLVAAEDYDPEGGDGEHPELVAQATDGNRETYWRTETYGNFEKSGVGIVFDARKARELSQLTVFTDTPGFRALVQAGDSRSGPFQPVSDEQDVARRTVFELDGGEHRYYLLWITALEDVAHVNEARAHS